MVFTISWWLTALRIRMSSFSAGQLVTPATVLVCSLEAIWVYIQESSAYLLVRVRRIYDDLFWSYEIFPFQWKLNLSFKISNLILRTRVYLYVLLSSVDFSYLRRGKIWSWWSDRNPASVKLLKCAESLKMCSSFSRLTVIFYCKLLTGYF